MVFFYCKSNFIRTRVVKVSERVRASLEEPDACGTSFETTSLSLYKDGLYIRECLYVMTLSNLLKCWLCDNGNLVLLLGFKDVEDKKAMHEGIFKEIY